MKPICNQSLLDGCHVLWYTDITNQKGNFCYAKVTVMLMFDTQKFGRAIATLRKEADMTQNEVADRLNLSRQAVSRYECGESFPDISILVQIAELFGLSLDTLIAYGNPTAGEAQLLRGGDGNYVTVADVVNLAPHLKPSALAALSTHLTADGIDISDLVALAEYLHDTTTAQLIERTSFAQIEDELLMKLLPFLNTASKEAVFRKLLDGDLDWHYIEVFLPYADALLSQVEAAVMEGALPWEVAEIVNRYCLERP